MMTPWGGLLTVAIVPVVPATALIRVFAWNYLKGWLVTGWATTRGRVEFGSVEEHRARYFSDYVARIDYSCSFDQASKISPAAGPLSVGCSRRELGCLCQPCHDLGNLDCFLNKAHPDGDFNHNRHPVGRGRRRPPFENSRFLQPPMLPGPLGSMVPEGGSQE